MFNAWTPRSVVCLVYELTSMSCKSCWIIRNTFSKLQVNISYRCIHPSSYVPVRLLQVDPNRVEGRLFRSCLSCSSYLWWRTRRLEHCFSLSLRTGIIIIDCILSLPLIRAKALTYRLFVGHHDEVSYFRQHFFYLSCRWRTVVVVPW